MPHPDELAPPARARMLTEMVDVGMTYREITEATGLSDYTVARLCDDLGLTPSRRDLTEWDARTSGHRGTA